MMDFGDLANYGLELISKYSEVQEYVWNKYVYITAKLVGHYIRKGVVKISLELLETHNA